jgi:membrane-bound ClpP family serine protease
MIIRSLFAVLALFCSAHLFGETFEEKLAAHITSRPNEKPFIGKIVIADSKNGISEATWIYVNSALNQYKKTKPICIILELNTPGGEVFAAQRISDALKEMDTQYGIPVIAYINNWAISAGAMLAYSCRYIVIAKDASMGAAEPVLMGETGEMKSAPEKVNSALRSDFVNRAKFFDRNGAIAEAMVDKDVILVKRDNEIIKLESEDQIRTWPEPDRVISPKGKLLTLSADELMEFGVADFQFQPLKLAPLTTQEEMSETVPLAKTPFSQIPFFARLPDCTIITYEMNWQTQFLALLTTPAVSSVLFLGMLICFYIEMSAGGFGLAGVGGILCLFFILLSSFAMEAIHWLEPILLLFGAFLLGLELFFFPTLGILGFIGVVFMIAGLGGMMLPGLESISFEGQTLNAAGDYVLTRLTWLSGALLLALCCIAILSRFMTPRFRLMQKLVLTDTKMLATGAHDMHARVALPKEPLAIGEEAEVSATLRPAGKIVAHDSEYDAVSTGSFIEKGKKVKVLHIEGEKIVVEEIFS